MIYIFVIGVIVALVAISLNFGFTMYVLRSNPGAEEVVKPVNKALKEKGPTGAARLVLADYGIAMLVCTVIGFILGWGAGIAAVFLYTGYVAGIIHGDYVRWKIGLVRSGIKAG